jgi:hypothetical protein
VAILSKRKCPVCAKPLERFLGQFYCNTCCGWVKLENAEVKIVPVPPGTAVVAVEWTDEDGKRVQKSFAHPELAREWYAMAYRSGRKPKVVKPTGVMGWTQFMEDLKMAAELDELRRRREEGV